MIITTIGIDLAKNVFQIHGVDAHGNAVLRKKLDRSKMAAFFIRLQPCLIGMEACGSAHYWGRKLSAMGHTVKVMAPQFVKPYVKTNKNDVADAEAICEAVDRPNMRFVPIKTDEQQAVLSLHRVRQSFIKVRTAQANQIRGLLSEFGIIIAQGITNIAKRLPEVMEKSDLPPSFRDLLQRLYNHLKDIDKQVDEMDEKIQQWHRSSETSRKLAEIPGVKQHREFSTSIEILRPGNFRRSNSRKGFCESLWKRPALTTGKLTTLFDSNVETNRQT